MVMPEGQDRGGDLLTRFKVARRDHHLRPVRGEALGNAVTPQLDIALSGKVPGALVTQNSGTPGGGTSVRIDWKPPVARSIVVALSVGWMRTRVWVVEVPKESA